MDYGKILSRAWQITWRWKILWVLGFLAAMGSGGGGGGGGSSSYSGNGSGSQAGEWGQTVENLPWDTILPILIGLACLAVLIGIALWVVSIIARGGLIAGVQQVEDEGSTTLGRAWRAGAKRFWTLLGITVITWLPGLVMAIVLIVLVVASVAGAGIGASLESEPTAVLAAMGPWLICGIPLCCGMIIVSLIMGLIQMYADRAAVLEGLPWIEAFKRGWEMVKRHIGPTLIFWLIFLVIGFGVGIVIFGVMAVVALPVIGVVVAMDDPSWLMALPICGGGLLLFIVMSLISAIVQTFTSSSWTLLYRELRRIEDQPAPVVEAAAPAEL